MDLNVGSPRPEVVPGPGSNGSSSSNPQAPSSGSDGRADPSSSAWRARPARGLRVGVVGVGYWGSKHLRVLRGLPDVADVVAIDRRLPQLPAMRHLLSEGRGFSSLSAGLPAIDAVVIATPPATHAAVALEAIRAGRHVLVEKPLATTTADARRIMAAADGAGVVLMVGHTFEHNGAVHLLRRLVGDQELGELFYLDSARLNLGLYQSDVNVIHDLAPHDISIANYVLGGFPTSVSAWGSRHVHPELEDVAYLRLEYSDQGVVATVHVSWLNPQKIRRTTAVGSKKMAVYDDMAAEERIRIYDKAALTQAGSDRTAPQVSYRHGDIHSPLVEFEEPLSVQDRQFVDCIRTGAQPTTDGLNGLAVVAALECAQLSLAERRPVALAEVIEPELLARSRRPAPGAALAGAAR